jgi:phosphoglycolate phosphatase
MQNSARNLLQDIPSPEKIKSTIGLSMQEVVQQLFIDCSADMLQRIRDHYREEYIHGNSVATELFKSVPPLISKLESHQITLSIATGKGRQGLERALQSVGWSDRFEFSVCGDEAESKPHPEMIHRLLNQTNTEASRALMIGDSVHDLAMANSAGVDAVGVTTGANSKSELARHKPAAIIDDIADLESLITRRIS